MKHSEAFRPLAAPKPSPAKPVNGDRPAAKKPLGPLTYTVSKGSDVFWSGTSLRK